MLKTILYIVGMLTGALFFYYLYFNFLFKLPQGTIELTILYVAVFSIFIIGLCIAVGRKMKRVKGVGAKSIAALAAFICALLFIYLPDFQQYFIKEIFVFFISLACGLLGSVIAMQKITIQFLVQKIFMSLLFSVILNCGLYNFVLYNPIIYSFFSPTSTTQFMSNFNIFSAIWWASFGIFVLVYAIVKIAIYTPAKVIAINMGFRMVEKTEKIHDKLLRMCIG